MSNRTVLPALLRLFNRARRRARLAFALVAAALGPVPLVAQTEPNLAAIRARADQADPEAQNALGNAYTNALLGLRQDYREALRWYERAASQGFAPAQFNVGLAHELGRGVPLNEIEAFKQYMRAAEQGFAAALFNVGNMYALGRGVAVDHYEASLWYRQAADKGMAEAQYNLGIAYEAGRGVKQDEAQAARWYRQAAERGYPLALYNLGLLFEEGRGVARDFGVAAELYRAAAARGVALAQNNYGLMLHEGRGGLPRNSVEALAWVSLAVENGAAPAARDALAPTLTPEQRDRAALRVEQLRQTASVQTATGASAAAPPTSAPPAAPVVATTPPPQARPARAESPPVVFKSKFGHRETGPEAEIATLKKENARLYDELTRASREVVWLNQQQRATRASDTPAQTTGDNSRELADQLAAARAEIQRLNNPTPAAQQTPQTHAENQRSTARPALSASAPDPELSRLAGEANRLRAEKLALEQRAAGLEKNLREQAATSAAFAEEVAGSNAKFAEARQQLTTAIGDLELEFERIKKLTVEAGALRETLSRPASDRADRYAGKRPPPQLPPAPRLPWINPR